MKYFTAFITGFIFSIGLGISGMMDVHKVQGFLDLAGKWDPSLAMVMGGAVTVTLIAFPLILKRPHPLLTTQFSVPTNTSIDKKLIMGGVLFGAGWGIGGFCPGPAIASLTTFNPSVLVFLVSMVIGWVGYQQVTEARFKKEKHTSSETKAFHQEQCVVD